MIKVVHHNTPGDSMFKRTQGRHRKPSQGRHRRPTELGHIHTVVLAFIVCVGLLPAAARVFS